MNKIIIDTNEYNLELKSDLYLDIRSDSIINLKVIDNNKINILVYNNFKNVTINLEMFDNTNMEINSLGINSNINYKIIQNSNTSLKVISSIITKVDSINNININHSGNDNKTIFYTNGINLAKNKLYFNLNGVINKDLINCYLDENSKIINLDSGDSLIIPNLIIDTKEVIANHSAFIGTFNIEELCYLMSRGISKENAKDLLLKSIILNGMKLNIEDFVDEINEFLKIRR